MPYFNYIDTLIQCIFCQAKPQALLHKVISLIATYSYLGEIVSTFIKYHSLIIIGGEEISSLHHLNHIPNIFHHTLYESL